MNENDLVQQSVAEEPDSTTSDDTCPQIVTNEAAKVVVAILRV